MPKNIENINPRIVIYTTINYETEIRETIFELMTDHPSCTFLIVCTFFVKKIAG